MELNNLKYGLFDVSSTYRNYFTPYKRIDFSRIKAKHTLLFVYSGKLTIKQWDEFIIIKEGEYVFFEKGSEFSCINNKLSENFCGLCISYKKSFLKKIQESFSSCRMPLSSKILEGNVLKLPYTPYLESLYVSFIPYLNLGIKPSKEILQIKYMEGVYCLLLTDIRFYRYLFDFKQNI